MKPKCPSFRSQNGGGVRNLALQIETDAAKNRGKMPHLNNSKSFWKNYAFTFQNTKHYLFNCSIFQLDWIVVPKKEDKNHISHCANSNKVSSRYCPTKTDCCATAYRLASKGQFQIFSITKLKAQDMPAENLSLARAKRMTRILLEHFLTCWREWRPKITVLTRLGNGLPPGSMNLKSSYISVLLWIKWFAQNFIKHKASGKVILLLDDHRAYCSSLCCYRLLLKITLPPFFYWVTILTTYTIWISVLLGL